ncbi:MAG TPA: polysaccharide pyruvyl transferase family protein [Sedimentisphaerales bacterium]|jgi:hypothetical protein|nr:polysaccharide pyruvyl transferase family protein [Sedimentisphaerales bacterium]HNU29642.1 polysaccharide pyruvyl transferase family protein [Sedimentisphaerales bacterium]
MHRPLNVGSALQAYALQRSIEKLGAQSKIIDYVYPNAFHRQASLKSRTVHFVNGRLKRLLGQGKFELFEQRFDAFLHDMLHLTSLYPTPEALQSNPPDFDVYVAGSDQVWRASYTQGDPSFFCAFAPVGARLISYASSFGVARVEEKYHAAYREYLRRFAYVSVREREAVDLVRAIAGREATLVLDPTLLLGGKEWEDLMPEIDLGDPYVLCYGNSYSDEYVMNLALHARKVLGLRVVWVFGRPWHRFRRRIDHVFDIGPLEFLTWVKHASLVLTQSLHGTIFALNFRRPFYSIHQTAKTANTRQMSLLRRLNCEDRGLEVGQPFPEGDPFSVDHDDIHGHLNALREESIDYLKTSLDL